VNPFKRHRAYHAALTRLADQTPWRDRDRKCCTIARAALGLPARGAVGNSRRLIEAIENPVHRRVIELVSAAYADRTIARRLGLQPDEVDEIRMRINAAQRAGER
jgi:hypothetical protein